MTIYYTENYLKNIQPEGVVPAGVLLCNAVKYTVNTPTLGTSDYLYLMTLPANSRIIDLKIKCTDAGASSEKINIGLIKKSDATEVDYDGLINSMAVDDSGTAAASLWGPAYVSGAAAVGITCDLGRLYLNEQDNILCAYAETNAIDSGTVIEVAVFYIMDYGQDFATTQAAS